MKVVLEFSIVTLLKLLMLPQEFNVNGCFPSVLRLILSAQTGSYPP